MTDIDKRFLRAAAFCATSLRLAQALVGDVDPWLVEHIAAIEKMGQMSVSGQSLREIGSDVPSSGQEIGADEVAVLLGVSTRTARRLGPKLGRKVGTVWLFRRDTIEEVAGDA